MSGQPIQYGRGRLAMEKKRRELTDPMQITILQVRKLEMKCYIDIMKHYVKYFWI